MGRNSTVTYEQVAAIAEALKGAGQRPTPRLIREQHGSGSLGTIHTHFKRWEAEQAPPAQSALVLPVPLQRSILDFVTQEIEQAKASLETQLSASRAESTDLARENERMAEEIEILQASIEELQAEASNRSGSIAVLEADLTAARDEAVRERQAAENARTELAKALLRLEAMPRLEAEHRAVLDQLKAANEAREAASKELAVAASQLENARGQLVEQNRHYDTLIQRMDSERTRIEAELDQARQEVRNSIADADQARKEAKAAAVEVAQLQEAASKELAVVTSQLEHARGQLVEQNRHYETLIQRMDSERARVEGELDQARKEVRSTVADADQVRKEAKAAAVEVAQLQGQIAALQRSEDKKVPANKPAGGNGRPGKASTGEKK